MTIVRLGTDSSGRPLETDDRTLAKLRLAESRLGFTFTIVQGSYRAGHGAAASADTHDKGGVIDLRTWNIPPKIGIAKAVLELRKAGLIAWHRTKAQGFDDHIHAVDYGNPHLSTGAQKQVVQWQEGANGLASHGRDDGPRVKIPKDPPKQNPIPGRKPGMNNVEYGRMLVEAGLKEIAKAPKAREAAHNMHDAIEKALEDGPDS